MRTCTISRRLHDCFEFSAIRGRTRRTWWMTFEIPTFTRVGRLMRKSSAEQETRGGAPLRSNPIIDYETLNAHKLLGEIAGNTEGLNDCAIWSAESIATLFCCYVCIIRISIASRFKYSFTFAPNNRKIKLSGKDALRIESCLHFR